MRKIVLEEDNYQSRAILVFILIYYFFVGLIRGKFIFLPLIIFLLNFSFTVLFFPLFLKLSGKDVEISGFYRGFSYSLLPPLVWLYLNIGFYFLFPPPHSLSFLGLIFSFVYLTIFLILFFWELILVYLTVRFSGRENFFQIVFMFMIYFICLIPFNFLLNDLVRFID